MTPESEFMLKKLDNLINFQTTGFETVELAKALKHIIILLEEIKSSNVREK